jgi:hypothetical protein
MNEREISERDWYREKLTEAFNGTINMGLLLPLGAIPKGYVTLKLNEGDIKIPVHVVKKATDPSIKQHNVRMETIERLPELLANPVFVFNSLTDEKALVAIVDAKDKSGRPVLVAMRPTKNGLNTISSIYGRNNFDGFILSNINAKSTLWVDEKKALNTVRPLELQSLQVDSAKNLVYIVSHTFKEKSSNFDINAPLFSSDV